MNAAFTSERLAVIKTGRDAERRAVDRSQLHGVAPTAGKNWTAIEGELRATRGEGVVILSPQTRYFSDPPTETNESAIRTFWNGQLYTVIGKPDPSGGWQVRLWWKPFVTLIWAGGALIAFGGALALLGRLWRRRRRREPELAGALRMSRAGPLRAADPARAAACGAGLAAGDARGHERHVQARGQAGAGVHAAARVAVEAGAGLEPISRPASRGSSMSSRAGACPASPRCRCCRISNRSGVTIDGIAVRDTPEDLADFLARNGDPYERIGSDAQSQRADRARLLRRARKLHRRWARDHPLPAYRRRSRRSDVPMILSKLEQAR